MAFQRTAKAQCMRFLLLLISLSMPLLVHAEWRQNSFSAMGTIVDLELWQSAHIDADGLFAEARANIERLEQLLSPYIENSDISRINRLAAQNPIAIDAVTFQIVERALYFSKLSEGAFDISFAAVGRLYDYRNKTQPSASERNALRSSINYSDIHLGVFEDAKSVSRYELSFGRENMAIDLGGIAKGFTVDAIAKLWQEKGVKSGAITIGGDSRFIGDRGPLMHSAQRLPWMIGIQHPRAAADVAKTEPKTKKNPQSVPKKEQQQNYALRLPLVESAFSTSGDYERYFIDENGARVHHIIDPRSGESAKHLVSVSVVGPNSMDCDALSTTLFILGREKGLALIESLEEYDAVMIDNNGKVSYSSGFQS